MSSKQPAGEFTEALGGKISSFANTQFGNFLQTYRPELEDLLQKKRFSIDALVPDNLKTVVSKKTGDRIQVLLARREFFGDGMFIYFTTDPRFFLASKRAYLLSAIDKNYFGNEFLTPDGGSLIIVENTGANIPGVIDTSYRRD